MVRTCLKKEKRGILLGTHGTVEEEGGRRRRRRRIVQLPSCRHRPPIGSKLLLLLFYTYYAAAVHVRISQSIAKAILEERKKCISRPARQLLFSAGVLAVCPDGGVHACIRRQPLAFTETKKAFLFQGQSAAAFTAGGDAMFFGKERERGRERERERERERKQARD